MGIDSIRFLNQPVDCTFVCPICNDVYLNPLQCPDEHSYCSDCITKWLTRKQTCPLDQKTIKVEQLRPAPRILRNLLDNLELRCEFAHLGCKEINKLSAINTHVTICKFKGLDESKDLKIKQLEEEVNGLKLDLVNEKSNLTKIESDLRKQLEQSQIVICKRDQKIDNLVQQLEETRHDLETSKVEVEQLRSELDLASYKMRIKDSKLSNLASSIFELIYDDERPVNEDATQFVNPVADGLEVTINRVELEHCATGFNELDQKTGRQFSIGNLSFDDVTDSGTKSECEQLEQQLDDKFPSMSTKVTDGLEVLDVNRLYKTVGVKLSYREFHKFQERLQEICKNANRGANILLTKNTKFSWTSNHWTYLAISLAIKVGVHGSVTISEEIPIVPIIKKFNPLITSNRIKIVKFLTVNCSKHESKLIVPDINSTFSCDANYDMICILRNQTSKAIKCSCYADFIGSPNAKIINVFY